MSKIGRFSIACAAFLAAPFACGNDNSGAAPPANTGQSCSADNQCYAPLDAAALKGGAPLCLTRVSGGYCTHHCAADTDCCAIPGECPSGFPEVCASFESTGEMYCFLSCDSASLNKAGLTDSTAFCQQYASAAFGCRSTGGGANNRKVCLP